MATQMMNKEKELPATRTGPLSTYSDFPFFLGRFRDEFDRMCERFFHGWSGAAQKNGNGWRWGLEVADEENAVIIRAEAPGFEAGDFDLQVKDGQLVLRASKKTETSEKGKTRETHSQEYYEAVTLPPGIEKDKVEAKYHNGILTISLPKVPEAKPKKIAVKSS